MKKLKHIATAVAAFLVCGVTQANDAYPNKPVKVIIPFAPGGITDTVTRRVMEQLSKRLGQPLVMENKTGANGMIGVDSIAKGPADGYSIVVVNPSFALNPSMQRKMAYAQEDLMPISVMARFPLILVASGKSTISTVNELVSHAKSPAGVTFASSGNGSLAHVASERFAQHLGTKMIHVPYRGSSPAIADVIGGQVTYILDAPSIVEPHVKAGTLRAVAVTAEKRIPSYPTVPTLAEAGYPGQNAYAWLALLVNSKTPAPIVHKLSQEVQAVLADPEMRSTLASFDLEVVNASSEQAATYIRNESEAWKKVIDKASIRAD